MFYVGRSRAFKYGLGEEMRFYGLPAKRGLQGLLSLVKYMVEVFFYTNISRFTIAWYRVMV